MSDVFETSVDRAPQDGPQSDVVRTAQTAAEQRSTDAFRQTSMDVRNVKRPRFGHDY